MAALRQQVVRSAQGTKFPSPASSVKSMLHCWYHGRHVAGEHHMRPLRVMRREDLPPPARRQRARARLAECKVLIAFFERNLVDPAFEAAPTPGVKVQEMARQCNKLFRFCAPTNSTPQAKRRRTCGQTTWTTKLKRLRKWAAQTLGRTQRGALEKVRVDPAWLQQLAEHDQATERVPVA
jgi:hypothetical protein